MSLLAERMDEVADALRPLQNEVADLQVYPRWIDVPSPPCIDIYPATPFLVGAGFGVGPVQVFLLVRARVAVTDPESAQLTLLRLLDPTDPASVEAALADAGIAAVGNDSTVSGFREYADDVGESKLLGCDWTVTTFL